MVTKVRTLRLATEFASNFEQAPASTTGNQFGFNAGSVVDIDGEVYEFSAGAIVVPGGTYTLYVDMAGDPPTLNLETTVTSGNYVALYVITNSSGNLSWTDVRSWTSASIGDDLLGTGSGVNDPLTSHEQLINGYDPAIWYRFNEADRPDTLVNWGTVGSDWDLTLFNPSVDFNKFLVTRVRSGDVEGGFAMPMSTWNPVGATGAAWRKEISSLADLSWLTASATGTWIICAAYGYDANSANDNIFDFDNSIATNDAEFKWGMSNDQLDIDFFTNSGTFGDWSVQTAGGINQQEFPTYVHMVLTQPGDGGGPLLYVDGADVTTYSGLTAGEEDYWFDTWTSNFPNTFTLGGAYSSPTSITSAFNGNIDQVAYIPEALDSTQVAALYAAYSGT